MEKRREIALGNTEERADRRTERRVPCSFVFSVRRASGEGCLASAVDISTGGMRFETVGSSIADDDSILVQFTVNSRTYSFCGRPLRIRKPVPFAQEVAVQFRAVDGRTRAFLAESIRAGLEMPASKDPFSAV